MLGVGSSAADVLHAAAVCSNSSLAICNIALAPLPPKLGAQERSQAIVAVVAMIFDYKLVNSNAIW